MKYYVRSELVAQSVLVNMEIDSLGMRQKAIFGIFPQLCKW